MNQWENVVALHECGHAVTAHVLGVGCIGLVACRHDEQIGGGRARGYCELSGTGEAVIKCAVLFAGGAAGALGAGVRYPWKNWFDIVWEVAAYRADTKRDPCTVEIFNEPIQAARWNVPTSTSAAAVSVYASGGLIPDLAAAGDAIDREVASITEQGERLSAWNRLWDDAQELALSTVKQHLDVIRRLAVLLFDNGGRLDSEQLQQFFEAERI